MICPICIVNPAGDPNQMVRDLAQHMTVEHQASGLSKDRTTFCVVERENQTDQSAPRKLSLSHSLSLSLTQQKGGERGEKEKKTQSKKKYFVRRKKEKKISMDLNDLKQNQNGGSRGSRRGDTIRELRRMIYPSRGPSSGGGRPSNRSHRSQNPSRDVPFMTFVQGKGILLYFFCLNLGVTLTA